MTQTPPASPSTPKAGDRLVARVGCTFAYGTTDVHSALLSFAVAGTQDVVDERILVHAAGRQVEPVELQGDHGTRLHLVEDVGTGWLEVTYEATVRIAPPTDSPPTSSTEDPVAEYERWVCTRQSRYAESDRLAATAARELAGTSGLERAQAAAEWVHTSTRYLSGSSRGTDGAIDTLLSGQGVCRDFAHLTIGLLRGVGVPARLVSVYAPGLQPMDFHAVVEAWVDGAWHIVDPTRLAPRESMVRIATGRDAADTAFLTTQGGVMSFDRQRVHAELVEGELPDLDHGHAVRLA